MDSNPADPGSSTSNLLPAAAAAHTPEAAAGSRPAGKDCSRKNGIPDGGVAAIHDVATVRDVPTHDHVHGLLYSEC